MAKEEAIEVMAKVMETLPNAMFRVELERVSTRCLPTSPERCASILFGFFLAIGYW
jgi:hypothetical protein